MAKKAFEIQGSDLNLGGVTLQAGTTGIVIPGITQATNYRVEEVERRITIGGNNPNTFGSNTNLVYVMDNAEYVYRSGGAQPSGTYQPAIYNVDELDDGRIEEVDVESGGTFAAADKTRVEAADMWAIQHALGEDPLDPFVAGDWTQIPYRPKIRAGEVTNVGGGSGGVVERSINFPQGESGDAAGTLALTPSGNLYICKTDWVNYSDAGGAYGGFETSEEYLPGQSGFVSNYVTILLADVPSELLYILQNVNINASDWSVIMDDEEFGGEQTCTNVGFNVDGNPSFSWPYRNGTDPNGIPAGSGFTVAYSGEVPQPAIWQQIDIGSLGDLTVFNGNEIVNGDGDITLNADSDLLLEAGDDLRLTADDDIRIRTYTSNVHIITNYDSNNNSDHVWDFDTTGDLTIPGNILKTTDLSITVGEPLGNVEVNAVDEWGPPGGPGGVWRLFIGDEAYPTLGTTVQIGDTVTTSWGTPITATITDIQQDNGNWQIHVDQDITAGHNDYDTVTFSTVVTTKTWTFDTDGVLNLPRRGAIRNLTGTYDVNIVGAGPNGFAQLQWTTLAGAAEANPNGTDELKNWIYVEQPGAYIETNVNGTGSAYEWHFDNSGVLHLPTNGDIVDSEGNSVLGGASSDPNIWVQTFVSDVPTEDFPQIATSVEYDSDGNVIALFSHFDTGGVEDSRYFSVGKYSATGTKIWTARFAADLETDGWGLAVDNADGWIYVAGQAGGDVYTYDVSTLTKIDSGDGSVAWSKIYDFGFASSSAVVDVDSTGNPVMVGWANNGTDSYLTVTKINKLNGNVTWTRKLDGQTNEQAYGMAVGPDGEIVAVGTVDNLNYPEPYRTIVTLTATPASDPDWTTDILGATVGGLTYDVTFAGGVPTFSNIVDTDGNRIEGDLIGAFNASQLGPTGSTNMEVRVGTTTGEDMSDRMVVVKYASNGTIAWQKAIQFDEDYDCLGADADIDSNGNIYICGQFNIDGGGGPTNTGMALVKFNSSGVKQWSRRVTGDCISTATSIVVGPDDKLYISGVNGDEIAETFTWVVAKYSLDGLVEWQRFIENTDSWTFAGGLFGPESGGSNIAVRQGYVALAGGFGAFDQQAYAAVLQIPDTGNVFAVGPWSVTAANLSGTLNGTASDIGVVNADLTDSDNVLTVEPDSVTIGTEVGAFLIGTLYTAPGGDTSLVNGVYSVTLENNGAVTLPAGGTITEGYVTSNPTIQLTPASPDVASQKLVIKGGGAYNYTDNGININYYTNTAIVGDTLTFYIYSPTYADQTLYWWIYPEGAGISDPGSGTVALTGNSGTISFELDSDDNEFTVRVSPEDHNYDPASLGVETGLINPDAPTFDSEHHLHLTTGDLTETSIFLGTDNHNVRTTVNGGIEITTPNIDTTNVWRFDNAGILTVPGDGIIQSVDNNGRLRSQLRLDEGSDITRLSAWSSPDNQSFTTSDWTTGTYTNNAGSGAIAFTGAETIISWLNANNYADRFFFTVNGGPQMESTGWGGGASNITFNVATPPLTSPTTVTSFSIYYQFESRLDIDTDDEEFYILSTGNDLYLETRQSGNIQIRSVDGLDLVGNGIVTLRNNSATNGIEIRTDDGNHSWNFGVDGKLTLPGAVVKSTVAKTGATSTTTGVVTGLTPSSALGGLTDGTYGPFTLTGVTLSVVVFGGVINGFTNVSGTATVNDVLGTIDSGDVGGTAGTTITITVTGVQQPTPTALDLTKSVNKLTDGVYTLADGVEGQIMYLVRQAGSTYNDIIVNVANARIDGIVYTTIDYYPFDNGLPALNMSTLIFTDGAWQADNGSWD